VSAVERRAVVLLAQAAALLVLLLAAPTAHAIPAFARAYNVPCSTCHDQIPRRNAFGDAFRKAGHRWPGDPSTEAAARKSAPIAMKGTSLLETALPAQLPLAIEATMSASHTTDPSVHAPIILGGPSLRFLAGGAFAEHASFFGSWGVGTSSPDELYLELVRLGGPELNVKVGRFEQSTTMFKSNEAMIAPFPLASTRLNGFAVSQGRVGAEATGVIQNRLFWASGVVRNNDVGTNFAGYYHVSTRVGGTDFSGNEPDVDLDHPTWVDDVTFTLANWGYVGKETSSSGENLTVIRRVGTEGKLAFRQISLWGGFMHGVDRDLRANRNTPNITWFAELSYPVWSWLVPVYQFQYQDGSSLVAAYREHDIGAVILLFENVRMQLSFSYSDDHTRNDVAAAQLHMVF
jgi:hypothetical protein